MEESNIASKTQKRARPEDSPDANRPPSTPSKPEPKRVACTHCRQSKLRCDSFERNPCSRCSRLNLNCSKDTGYKRVNKKTKVDELEQELHQLKAVLVTNTSTQSQAPQGTPTASPSTQAAAASLASFPSSGFAFEDKRPYYTHSDGLYSNVAHTVPPMPRFALRHESHLPQASEIVSLPALKPMPHALKVRAIESTALSADQITDIFQRFFANNHPFLPMLDASTSPDDFYDTSQLLFWCIIVVGARNWPSDRTLSCSLYKVVYKMAWERIADPPVTVQTIQALLILCMWPATSMHLWSDIAMSFGNIAITSAMHTGLHRPDYAHEFVRKPRTPIAVPLKEGDRVERGKVWAACNIVSQHMTVGFGHPPLISCFDWYLDRACETGNKYTLPDDLRHHLILQKFSHRTTQLISNNRADPLGLPNETEFAIIMDMLEADLGVIEAQISFSLSILTSLILAAVRVHLQSLHWLRPEMTSSRRAGILRSYSASCNFITLVLSQDNAYPVLRYCPIFFLRNLLNAGYVVHKILNSSFRVFVDQIAGAALVADAQVALRRMSAAGSDLPVRAASILQDIWAHRNDDASEKDREPGLALRSRLSYSLTSDAAWKWRTYYTLSKDGVSKKPIDNNGAPGVADMTGNGLQQDDPSDFAFNWDFFDDLDWNWAFENPIVEGMTGAQ